ncbi:ribosomal protein S18 acetylase RimI-like enzyme [Weissella beninensis]|uniref:GNAT family N-acetyltransferase n=1 Tax=Periweissella beninensis TaxID=504936 RepID=UPI0019612808|nr:GNAT family N-acetyltransferase [Periweissella beninensis]MBM7544896.1 ribosomal protein S18 acetylase RimI-like enzyme [Periweissella beninensis]
MNNNYNIRLVVEPDMPKIQILAVETFFESFNDGAKSEDIQLYLQNEMSYQNLISEFNAKESSFIVIEDNKTKVLIGYMKINMISSYWGIHESNNNLLEIERIYILSDYQSHGLGLKPIEFAKKFAKLQNINTMVLSVYDKNKRGLSFYEKNGFKVVTEHNFLLGKDNRNCLVMECSI